MQRGHRWKPFLASSVFFILGVIGSGCVGQYGFAELPDSLEEPESPSAALPPPNSEICAAHPEAPACSRDPQVKTPGVVTILFTMSQIPQGSATLILANAIKYASPVANPKILF